MINSRNPCVYAAATVGVHAVLGEQTTRNFMMQTIQFNKNPFLVLDTALESIPSIRSGKSDVMALVSFSEDIAMFRRFRRAYLRSYDDLTERKRLLGVWNKVIALRDAEDYVPHFESQNYEFYKNVF